LIEEKITQENASAADQVTYTDIDLKRHFDGLEEVCLLIEDEQKISYLPKDREWIKKKLITYLKKSMR
jgi:hypothetical protein